MGHSYYVTCNFVQILPYFCKKNHLLHNVQNVALEHIFSIEDNIKVNISIFYKLFNELENKYETKSKANNCIWPELMIGPH